MREDSAQAKKSYEDKYGAKVQRRAMQRSVRGMCWAVSDSCMLHPQGAKAVKAAKEAKALEVAEEGAKLVGAADAKDTRLRSGSGAKVLTLHAAECTAING